MKLNWSHIGLTLSSLAIVIIWVISYMVTKTKKVENIEYTIESIEGARNLISDKEIKNMVDKVYNIELENLPVSELDLARLEDHLKKDNRIYESELHLDANRVLHVNVIQRRPIVRIIDKTGAQYYLDQEGKYISKHDFKAIRVPIATGIIEAFDQDWKTKKESKIKQCYDIVSALRKDDFLTALVEQINFEDQRIVMIPKMSSEIIVIKHLDHLDRKLNNLKIFYKTEMTNNDSWGKYKEIDISYYNQVVTRTTNQLRDNSP